MLSTTPKWLLTRGLRVAVAVLPLSLFLALPVGGHEGHDHPPKAVEAKEAHKPTALPDRIVLTFADDPTTNQSVTWRTSTEVKKAYAEIAVATPGREFETKAEKLTARSQGLKTDLGEAHYHAVQFTKLQPATKYAYRVGDGANWSEWFHFTTASTQPEPFSFIYFGDAQNDVRSLWSRVIREAYGDAPKARFMIHAGDLINNADSDAEWGEWFNAGHWLNAMMPSVPVPGNHEMAKLEDGSRRLSHHWKPQFSLPENGPKGLEETCYTLVYQGVRIIGLNSNQDMDAQAAWLDGVLARNKARWVVCTFHHPVFSSAKERDNAALRSAWKPVFDKYRVDLVLTGHDHTYARTGLETPGSAPATVANVPTGEKRIDQRTGTVYVVSVSGPKMYNLQRQEFMKRAAEDTQLYQIIHVDGASLRYEARTATGEVYDAFTLEKRADGEINELIEQIPDTPERLRAAEAK
jgi:3',5'-cyclic AMP phosphodiesterase CpdA